MSQGDATQMDCVHGADWIRLTVKYLQTEQQFANVPTSLNVTAGSSQITIRGQM